MKNLANFFVIAAVVAMVAFPGLFSGLSAQEYTIGWVPNLRVTQKNLDPISGRWTVTWEWSLAKVNERPSMSVGYLLFDEDGENITPCGGNYVLETTTWSQSVDFTNCPDNFSGRDGDGGNWFFKTGESHGLMVQPVAINERGHRIYGTMSDTVYCFLEADIINIFLLFQNYPNPFNATTNISYWLAEPINLRLIVYNILGQAVRILEEGTRTAGSHSVVWDGLDQLGHKVSSGVYLYRLETWQGDKLYWLGPRKLWVVN